MGETTASSMAGATTPEVLIVSSIAPRSAVENCRLDACTPFSSTFNRVIITAVTPTAMRVIFMMRCLRSLARVCFEIALSMIRFGYWGSVQSPFQGTNSLIFCNGGCPKMNGGASVRTVRGSMRLFGGFLSHFEPLGRGLDEKGDEKLHHVPFFFYL